MHVNVYEDTSADGLFGTTRTRRTANILVAKRHIRKARRALETASR